MIHFSQGRVELLLDRNLKKYILWGLLVLLCIGSAWGLFTFIVTRSVLVVHPVRGPAIEAVYAPGTVEGAIMMPVSARSAARLTQLKVDEGNEVSRGQELALLEDEDLKRNLEELESREKWAKSEFERQETLRKLKVSSLSEYQKAKSEFEAATAAVAKAKVQLSYMTLVSPEDGKIIKRDGEIGELIGANQPVFWLMVGDTLRISAEVDEEDITKIHPGQQVLIRADAFPGAVYKGSVQSITPKGDPIARSYRVRVSLVDNTQLKIGMTTEVNIIIKENPQALLIPTKTLLETKVLIVENGRVAERVVQVGVKGEEQTEVLSGIDSNDFVVLNPERSLSPGDTVRMELNKTD